MKKLILIGLLLATANVFGQIQNEPLSKELEKQVKNIQKDTKNDLEKVVDSKSTAAEKKARVSALKDERNAKLAAILSAGQTSAVLANDPIKWDDYNKQIDKQDAKDVSEKQSAEKEQKLNEVSTQQKELTKQKEELKQQMKDLETKQKGLEEQQKVLKDKEKEIKKQYK